MNTDIKNEMINTKARIRYKLRTEQGRNTKLIPKEQQKKRGRKNKQTTEQRPTPEPKEDLTLEQLNKQYDIIKNLVGVADNKYIIEKLRQLNRQNEYIKKIQPEQPEQQQEQQIIINEVEPEAEERPNLNFEN